MRGPCSYSSKIESSSCFPCWRCSAGSNCCYGTSFFFFSSRRRHTRYWRDWSSDVCSSDLAYNGVHPRLMEANQNQKRDEWMSGLDKMESLKPRIVVAGHKNMKNDDDGPRVIGQTRQYILDFQEVAGKTTTAKELYDQMLARYPEWLNRGALWSSTTAIKR